MTTQHEAEHLLHILTGNPAARFRPGQWEAIDRLVHHRGRALVVQRTGWGKSAVYFLATRLLRDQGAGPTVLISPLLALMRNQLQMAERAGIRAATINSANTEAWDEVEEQVQAGGIDVLLVSPERLQNHRFRDRVLPGLVKQAGLLVVDEAHCISDWGHDFRPDYRLISRVLRLLPSTVPVLCTTATANDRVVEDIAAQLGEGLEVLRGPLGRESLELASLVLSEPAQRLAWLATVIADLPGSGIVYCLTVADARRVAEWLKHKGIDAASYTGEHEGAEREALEEKLLANEVKVVVATSALGMGFDKPDLSFVVHFQSPGSVVAYYQQVGRAGRGLDRAVGILLRGREDAEIQDYFIESAFPAQNRAEEVVALLAARAEAMTMFEIEQEVNIRHGRLENMLKVLEVDGAVERVGGGGWQRTLKPWAYDADRVARVTATRRKEQAAMVEYGRTDECRMAFLRRQLDDPEAEPCGRCDNCTGKRWPTEVDTGLAAEAAEFLRHAHITVEPRKQWPKGPTAAGAPRGNIALDLRLLPGRALSVAGDGGWGRLVRQGRSRDGGFGDELVDAMAELLARWGPDPAPQWVACVPSAAHPELVPAFAERLAGVLGLPFLEAVRRTREARPQKEMENSAQQFGNVYGAFEVMSPVPPTPVLLVDDIVDSGWTLTTVGVALREAGSGPVLPVVLARAVGA
ncbi:MAG TPA: RecQ family ATP-dependent DNA helicase [Acidimicrobiales bacterium]|nr:RecQ family ATP-dependent DNA helicase [Acidimicrobiales bacterium]